MPWSKHGCAQGPPFATLIREALVAYLANTPPTPADTLQRLAEQVAALTTRVDALERELTARRQQTDSYADTLRSRKLTPRQMAALLTRRPCGTPIKELVEEFGVCRSTVFRYLKKAREAGLLQGPKAHEERLGT
jgi:CRP-like cAMP-binding protein